MLEIKFRESTSTIGHVAPFEREESPYDDGLEFILEAKEDEGKDAKSKHQSSKTVSKFLA